FFAEQGVRVERVMTDRAYSYIASRAFRETIASLQVRHKVIRPYRPQTNGKAERFIQTLLAEWAYAKLYRSNQERRRALPKWLHHYNYHRPHTALRGQPAVAERTGCTVSEPLWWGSHPYHHLGMPSTVVIPEEIFTGFLRAMIAGFWNMGFRKQILLNGHGQEYVIPTAIHQFGKRYRVPALVINLNWYHAVPDHFKLKSQGGPYETPFIHADEVESSWCLALFPELMKQEWA